MINSREYHLLNKRSLHCIKSTLSQRLVDWSTDWLTNDVDCRIGTVAEVDADKYQELTDSKQLSFYKFYENKWCVFVYGIDFKFQMSRSLFDIQSQLPLDNDKSKNLLDHVVDESISDLSRQLSSDDGFTMNNNQIGVSIEKIPDEVSYPGSGCFIADVIINDLKFKVILSSGTAEGCLSVAQPEISNGALQLVDVEKSIDHQPLGYRVGLGGAELTLDELVTLQVGDVLTLDHNINDMLTMRFDESPVSLSGYLGKVGDNKSFRVKSLDNADKNISL